MKHFDKKDAPEVAAWIMLKMKSSAATIQFSVEDGECIMSVAPLGVVCGKDAVVASLIAVVEGLWDAHKLG